MMVTLISYIVLAIAILIVGRKYARFREIRPFREIIHPEETHTYLYLHCQSQNVFPDISR